MLVGASPAESYCAIVCGGGKPPPYKDGWEESGCALIRPLPPPYKKPVQRQKIPRLPGKAGDSKNGLNRNYLMVQYMKYL